jgi:hypothetical protein
MLGSSLKKVSTEGQMNTTGSAVQHNKGIHHVVSALKDQLVQQEGNEE